MRLAAFVFMNAQAPCTLGGYDLALGIRSLALTLEPKGNHFVARIDGALDERLASELGTAVARMLDENKFTTALFDLRGVEQTTALARERLTDMQRALAARHTRTAYLADQARFRGFAGLVIHFAGDQNARAFPTEHQTKAWLASSESRKDYVGRLIQESDQAAAKILKASKR